MSKKLLATLLFIILMFSLTTNSFAQTQNFDNDPYVDFKAIRTVIESQIDSNLNMLDEKFEGEKMYILI